MFKCFKGFARDADFPRHRIIFSHNELKKILEDSGYQVKFITPPRINLILNFISCSSNICNSSELYQIQKIKIIIIAIFRITLHLLMPGSLQQKESPEIVLYAKIK